MAPDCERRAEQKAAKDIRKRRTAIRFNKVLEVCLDEAAVGQLQRIVACVYWKAPRQIRLDRVVPPSVFADAADPSPCPQSGLGTGDAPSRFIEKYSNDVEWETITFHQSLSERFINRHQAKMSFISAEEGRSEAFLYTHFNKLDAASILEHQQLQNVKKYDPLDVYFEVSRSYGKFRTGPESRWRGTLRALGRTRFIGNRRRRFSWTVDRRWPAFLIRISPLWKLLMIRKNRKLIDANNRLFVRWRDGYFLFLRKTGYTE